MSSRLDVSLWRDESARAGERDHDLGVTGRAIKVDERSQVPRPDLGVYLAVLAQLFAVGLADPANGHAVRRVVRDHRRGLVGRRHVSQPIDSVARPPVAPGTVSRCRGVRYCPGLWNRLTCHVRQDRALEGGRSSGAAQSVAAPDAEARRYAVDIHRRGRGRRDGELGLPK